MIGSEALTGRVALVTGAGFGLGRAIAARLAASGASVLLTDIDDRLEANAAVLANDGLSAAACRCDVTDRASVQAAAQRAVERFGRLDILVNNAGYSRTTQAVIDLEIEEWERSLQVNTRSVLFGIQAAAPVMIAQGNGGRIINIASTAAFRPYRMKAAYCASKAALVSLTQVAALELAAHAITVNAVAPGQTDTETTRLLQQDPVVGAAMAKRAEVIPLGLGRPEHIADTVAFLASSAAVHMTGQTLLVDGGTLLV